MIRRLHLWMVFLVVCFLRTPETAAAEVETLTRHLGDIVIFSPQDRSRKVRAEFLFTNDTNERLTVERIKPSCGCTKIHPDADSVEPGKPITFLAEVDLAGKPNLHTQSLRETVLVQLRGPSKQRDLVLEMKADVRVSGFPVTIDLGLLKGEDYTVERYFEFGPAPSGNLLLKGVLPSSPLVQVRTRESGGAHRVYFQFDMDKMPPGPNTFTLTGDYLLDGNPNAQAAVIRFTKVPKVSFPAAISLGIITAGQTAKSQAFNITPGYQGAAFEIKTITANPSNYLKCSWTRGASGEYQATVELDATELGRSAGWKGRLRLEFVQNDLPPVEIPVFAFFESAAAGPLGRQ